MTEVWLCEGARGSVHSLLLRKSTVHFAVYGNWITLSWHHLAARTLTWPGLRRREMCVYSSCGADLVTRTRDFLLKDGIVPVWTV